MKATVAVGDVYEIAGEIMTVVEVKRQTDSNGTVFFDSAPVAATVKLLEDRPLVVSGDEYFACYLLVDSSGRRYCVGVYHPTLGERIQPSSPRQAPFSEEFVMCWAPGPLRVLIDGEPAAGQGVSIVLERRTQDGLAFALMPDKYKVLTWSDQWQALVDSGQRDFSYKCDADGYVYNDALGEPVMFPRGHGAVGQRASDRLYDGADEPQEYLERAWLYFRGQRVEIAEGQAATLDWRTATIQVAAPPGTRVMAELDDVGNDAAQVTVRKYGEVPADGVLMLDGLYPGRWCVSAWAPGSGTDDRDWSQIARRQWVEVGPGETGEVSVSFQEPEAGYNMAYIYTSGADSQAGIEVWGLVVGQGWTVIATTDASGLAVWPEQPVLSLMINDPRWGYQALRGDGPTYEATLAGYVVLGLSLGSTGEGGWWAFTAEAHDHLDCRGADWKVVVEETGEEFALEEVPIGARTVAPVPHLPPGTIDGWNFTPPEATYTISLYTPDGQRSATLIPSTTVSRDGRDESLLCLETLGGKAWGDVLAHSPRQAAEGRLPEAARIGLEHGEFHPAIVYRLSRPEGQGEAQPREAWQGFLCPYCLCMAQIWPGPGYGRCSQCGADVRSHLHTPPAPDGRWVQRIQWLMPGARRGEVACELWYRPLRYAETDDYLRMYEGLPRWVCEHPVLGEWQAGAWIGGVDAEDLEGEGWVAAGERLLIRPKVQIVAAAGWARYRLRYRDGDGELGHVDFEIAPGQSGLVLLSALAPVWAERNPAKALFVRRVTSVELLEPEADPGNRFLVVGDVPSLIEPGLDIKKRWASPIALQVGPLAVASGPDLRRSPDGRLFLAYCSGGDIYVTQRPSPQRPWSEPVRLTWGGHYADPSIAILPTGAVLVAYTDVQTQSQCIAVSFDDGEHWQAL